MKKIIAVAIMAFGLMGCGNRWEITKKNYKSDFSDLPRHVIVYDSWTGKTVWEYKGNVYLEDSVHGKGNYTVIYRDADNKVRKNDFIGCHLAIIMRELTPEIEEELKESEKDASNDKGINKNASF